MVSVMCKVIMDLAQDTRKNDAAQCAKDNEAHMEENMGQHASMDQIPAVNKTCSAENDGFERQIKGHQRKLNTAVDPGEIPNWHLMF